LLLRDPGTQPPGQAIVGRADKRNNVGYADGMKPAKCKKNPPPVKDATA
jgi:hypothetical protein